MCGICGFVRWGSERSTTERLMGLRRCITEMVSAQRHRGPDDEGTFVKEKQHYSVALGHNRLSIIDLSVKASQPLHNEDGTVWITYNGEIYNYPTLRTELVEKGHQFISSSDTEVLVHGYEQWGTDLFSRLDGIFAFAIWDDRTQSLILCRDYFGVKPLHYYRQSNALRFSSEIKAILTDPRVKRVANTQAIHNLVNLRYNASDETLFKDIFRLRPGFFAVYKHGQFYAQRYASSLPRPDITMDQETALEELKTRLAASVRKQLLSDVPLGICLSGGIDSSSLAAMRAKVLGEKGFHTFTLGFTSEKDEISDANSLAQELGCNHHSLFSTTDLLAKLPTAVWHLEEPKINALQGFVLSEFVSRYVKVAFSGLGGDELFAGYNYHKLIRWGHSVANLVPVPIGRDIFPRLRRQAFRIQQKLSGFALDEARRGLQMLLCAGNPADYYLIPRNAWDIDAEMWTTVYQRSFLKEQPQPVLTYFGDFFRGCTTPDLDKTLRAEFWTKMINDLLLNEDRMFMAHGVESRVPLLDKDLVHFAFSIPAGIKMTNGVTKYVLKEAMRNILPPQVLSRPKAGFQFSSYRLFKDGLRDLAIQILTRENVESRKIFNYQYIRKILDTKPSRSMRWHYFFLLMLVGLEYWFNIFIDGSIELQDYSHAS